MSGVIRLNKIQLLFCFPCVEKENCSERVACSLSVETALVCVWFRLWKTGSNGTYGGCCPRSLLSLRYLKESRESVLSLCVLSQSHFYSYCWMWTVAPGVLVQRERVCACLC